MQISTLQNQIKTNNLNNVYIFTGDCKVIRDMYIKKLSIVSGLPVKVVPSVSSIVATISGSTLWNNTDACWVVINDNDFTKYGGELKVKRGIVIICVDSIDKRSSFYRNYKNCIVDFGDANKESLVRDFLVYGYGLSNGQACELMQRCNGSLDRAILEADKITVYAEATNSSVTEAFDKLVLEIPIAESYDVFAHCDAVLNLDKQEADKWFTLMQFNNEPVFGFLSLLYRDFENVLRVQTAVEYTEKSTGITPYVINITRQYKAVALPVDTIKSILRRIADMDKEIKSGKVEPYIGVGLIQMGVVE